MNRFLAGCIVLALLASSNVYAVVYNYTGANFDAVNGAYTTSMRITGSFSTSSPIPPNSINFDATGIVTSWSFSDGLQTINSTNGVIYPNSFSFSTDGSGNITVADLAVVNAPLATAVGQKNDVILISSFDFESNDFAGIQVICAEVAEGICSEIDEPEDFATVNGVGQWTLSDGEVKAPVTIPTLSSWGIVALILLMSAIGFARQREKSWR